jgi:hypothetical protein
MAPDDTNPKQDQTSHPSPLSGFLQEIRDAVELMTFAIAKGFNVDDKIVDALKKAEEYLLNEAWPPAADRSAFEKAYRDLAQFMKPVNIETLRATRDGWIGPRRMWITRWLTRKSDATLFSTKLWFWIVVSVLFTLALPFLSSLYIPNDEESARSFVSVLLLALKQLSPFVFGLLGALTYLLRCAHGYIADRTFDMERIPEYYSRMLLGFVGGGIVLLFVDPKAVGYGQDTVSFVVGYNTDILFDLLERVAGAIASKSKDGGATSKPGVASVTVSPRELKPGGSGTATVTLKSAAPAAGVTVSIAPDAAVTAPSTVSVPAGANSAQFSFTVKDGAKGKVSVSASANGSSATDHLTVS